MVGHDTVVVQDNLNNAQQGAELEKQQLEDDKLKNEEKEVENPNLVKQQVVQTGDSNQTAGMGTKTDAPVTPQTIQAQNVTAQGLEDLRGSLFSEKGFEKAAGCKIKDLPSDVSDLDKLLKDYSYLINSPEAGTEQNRKDMIKTLEKIQSLVTNYLKKPEPIKSGVTKVGNWRFNKKSGKVNKAQLEAQLKLKEKLKSPLGALQVQCGQKIERLKAGESVIPPKRTILPTSGPLPTPGKPRQQVPGQRETIAKTANLDEKKTLQNQSGYNDKKLINSFSKEEFEELSGKKISKLKGYKKLGELLDQYGNLLQQGHNRDAQGRTLLIDKLNEIVQLTKEYQDNEGTKDRKVAIAMGNYRRMAMEKIEGFQKENPDPNYGNQAAAKRTSGPLPMPVVKPVVQEQQKEQPKPVAQKQLPPVPPKPVAQEQQEERPKPVVHEQQPVPSKPVVQEIQQSQTETQTGETQQSQAETNTEGTQQQEEPQNDLQQQQTQEDQQQQTQASEPSGPSMRKTLLDELKLSERLGGRAIDSAYKNLIDRYEALYQVLDETITEDKQKESWEKLKKAYVEVAALSDQYARAYLNAPTAVGRVCRRYARMLLFMCNFDMRTLQIANKNPDLAKKNTTWRQILEQPAAPATQQTQTQQTEAQQTETQQTEAQQTEAQDAVQTNQPKGDTARDFRDWKSRLEASEKGGRRRDNSEYYNSVQDALEQAAKAMEQGFDRDSQGNMKKLSEATVALQALLDACKAYTARNPRTRNGKIRKNIVLQIQKYAAQDVIGCQKAISDFIHMEPEKQADQTWISVFQKARSVQLTVANYSKLGSAEGGAASDTIKIELQEGDGAVTKYFKKEDSFNLEIIKEKGDDAPHYFALQDTLQKYPNLSAKDKKLLQELSHNGSLKNKKFSEAGLLAAEYCKKRTEQVKNTIDCLIKSLGIMEEGGMANMSRRNVATSRIAELLGLENLVAKSRTVDILDQATGQTIRGNLMDQAEGKEYSKVENAITENKIDPGFIRDLTNLQVLDILCGQVDRHRNNMLYKTDDQGTVIGVQGIDNDGAFGTNTDVASAKNPYRKDLRVFDPETLEMIIPFMDDGLATRIEQLDSATIRYVLKDLLTDEEIEATGKRLDLLQKGIKKARDEHSDRFLKEEKDWTVGINNQDPNKKTVEEEMLDSYDDNVANADPDSDVGKERIKKMAAEKFKDDPKIVSGINLFYDDDNKFFEKYSSEEIREIMRERIELRRIILDEGKVSYRNNRNYFGRIMRKHDH